MTPQLHRQILSVSLGLYFIATWCSMAGMEFFGWLTFALTVSYSFRSPQPNEIRFRDIEPFLPWKSCLLLLLITCIGLAVNRTATADPVYDIGSQRWMFLILSNSLALGLLLPGRRGYRTFLICVGIVAVYAVFQSITGIDLMRPGSHRAVQPLGLDVKLPLWRSAGFFGSPMQYGHIAGEWVCFPLAMALLTARERHKRSWLFWGSLLVFLLLAASIVTTFTRGAWIAAIFAWLTVSWFAARRLTIWLAAAGAAVFVFLFATLEIFRARILTLFDLNYFSNSDRLFLWKANWEMFKDYPIFGIGYQENETRAGEYVTRLGNPNAFTGHAHNNYLQMLSGTGITGFLTYMFIIGFMLWITIKLIRSLPSDLLWPRALAIGAIGAQIHLHIGGLTECNFKAGATSHNTMMTWGFVIALSALQARHLLKEKVTPDLREFAQQE